MRRFLIVAVFLAVVSLYMLTIATGNSSKLADYFWWILAAAGILIGGLLAVLMRYVWLLMRDSRRAICEPNMPRRLSRIKSHA